MLGKIKEFFKSKKKFDYEYEIYYLLLKDKTFKDGSFTYRKVGFETQNTLAQVNFDYKTVYRYEDDPSEEVVGFFHTHPKGCNYMSSTDKETMASWAKCLGRPLLCKIDSYYSVDSWWCFPNGEIIKVEKKSNDDGLDTVTMFCMVACSC